MKPTKDLYEAIKERYDYWKKIGFDLKISEDKKHIVFANNHEKLPCYIDIQNGHICCYGDYSNFIFDCEIDLTKDDLDLGYVSRKYGGRESMCFDFSLMSEELEEKIKELQETNTLSHNFTSLIRESFEDFNGTNLDEITENILREVEWDEKRWETYTEEDLETAQCMDCFDWKESMYDWFGFAYESHFIAQLVILKIAHEELTHGTK